MTSPFSRLSRGLGLPALLAAGLGLAGPSPGLADAMKSSDWSGARASVQAGWSPRMAMGHRADVADAAESAVTYGGSSAFDPAREFTANVKGGAAAKATGESAGLLVTTASYSTPNPGTVGGPPGASPPVSSTAAWRGDRVVVSGPAGSALPESVRLDFGLDFRGTGADPEGLDQKFTIDANGRPIDFTLDQAGRILTPDGLDSLSAAPIAAGAMGREGTATFHLDLPVHDGVSDPFDLRIESAAVSRLMSNMAFANDASLTLSLLDVRLPDGGSLDQSGLTVAFASGLNYAQPIPEPATFGLWAVAAGVGLVLARRSRGR